MGAPRYPTARRLMITADAGGSNGYRNRLWKVEVSALAADTGLRVLAEWDQGSYPGGVAITDAQLAAVPLAGHDWHPDWNYDITPGPLAEPARTTRK